MRHVDLTFVKVVVGLVLAMGGLGGCGKKADMAPGARLLQSNPRVWAVCDTSRGTLLYFTEGGPVHALPLACIDGRP
jgi:hypothetical protein